MNFFTKYKKIFLIIGFVIISVAWGYILYILFFKTADITPTEKSKDDSEFISNLPNAADGSGNIIPDKSDIAKPSFTTTPIKEQEPDRVARGKETEITKLNDSPSIGITIDKYGSKIQYYNQDDKKFYTVDKKGNIKKLSDKVFHDVEKIIWSPAKDKAILEYPDGSNIVYNFETDKQVTLPKHWENFSVSANGDKLVMKSIGLGNENKWLAITNDDGSKSKKIEPIGVNADKVIPSWSPNNQSIAMYIEGKDFNRQEVYFVGLNGENFKSTIIEGRGFEPLWAPNGDRLLYSVYSTDNNLKPKLWIVDAQGESIGNRRTDLNMETWAHKCTFSGSHSLYCAVPESLEEGAGVFPELSEHTNDRLYKIDTNTGIKKLIAIPDGEYNISKLIISDGEREAFFTDAKTQTIHKIRLK